MIQKELQNKILILDGAMGTMIQKAQITNDDFYFEATQNSYFGNNDLLNLTRPDVIQNIHKAYIDAGADIIETNTFNANSISQTDYNLQDYANEIAFEGAKIAKKVAEQQNRKVYVAGAVGPTNKMLSMSPDVMNPSYRAITFDELVDCYQQQVSAIIRGGVDTILIETIFDTLNAKAAIYATRAVSKTIPIMISGTITDNSGRLLSGQSVEAFWNTISYAKPISVGFNCALGAEQLFPYIERLKKVANTNISAYPNAGLPNELGAYDQSPTLFGTALETFLEADLLNIVGGCCGTTPAHIERLKQIVSPYNQKRKNYESVFSY